MNKKQAAIMKAKGGDQKVEGRFFVCFCGKEIKSINDGTEEIRKHCKKEHNIRVLEGERSLVMHGDGRDFYMYLYCWDFGGDKKILDCIIKKRK